MKAKIYAIERGGPTDTTELKERPEPISKIGVILEPETWEDEIVLEFIDYAPQKLVIKTSGLVELEGKWVWQKL